jgi:hypothetical protein
VTFNIVWAFGAIDSLQRIYDSAPDKEGLIHTVTRIGLELQSRPHEAGESRDANERILFKHPLVVTFRIIERLQTVVIFRVGTMR